MGFVLLFVEGLAAVWLLAAAVTAGAGRLRPWWVQIALGLLALSLPAYTFVAMLGASARLGTHPTGGPGRPAWPCGSAWRMPAWWRWWSPACGGAGRRGSRGAGVAGGEAGGGRRGGGAAGGGDPVDDVERPHGPRRRAAGGGGDAGSGRRPGPAAGP